MLRDKSVLMRPDRVRRRWPLKRIARVGCILSQMRIGVLWIFITAPENAASTLYVISPRVEMQSCSSEELQISHVTYIRCNFIF